MAIVTSLLVLHNLLPWQLRLRSDAFLQPPWHDRHPARLAIAHELPADALHLARTLDRLVDDLSLAELVASYTGRGSTPHRPDLLLKAVLFLTQRGLHRPATWYQQAHENRVVAWLVRGCRPARACWYAFRQRLVAVIDPLNQQLLQQASQQGLLDVEVPVLDGTLLAANSSRHKLFNQDALQRRLLQLQQALSADGAAPAGAAPAAAGVVCPSAPPAPPPAPCRPPAGAAAAAPADRPPPAPAAPVVTVSPPPPEAAPASAGGTTPPGWMAGTPQGRVHQQQRYLKAQQELDRRLEHNARRRKEDRKPPEQVRISLGDPEATLGLDKEKVYRPLYNVQVVSDLKTDFCLAYEVFSGVPDAATLKSMLERLSYFLGAPIERLLTDAGYATGANLRLLEGEHIELIAPWQENDWTKAKKKDKQIPKSAFTWDESKQTYTCPEGHDLKYVRTQTKRRGEVVEKHPMYQCAAMHCQNCPRQPECTKNAQAGRIVMRNEYEAEVQRHRHRMQSAAALALYKKRKEQIERRLADSKEHRQLRKLSMRGQAGAKVQVGLTVLANNLVVLAKRQTQSQAGP